MKKWMLIPALAGVVAVSSVALADDSVSNSAVTAKQLLTLQQAKELAVQQVGGHVTEIELEKRKAGPVYEVEIESKGTEYELDIDAITGAVTVRKQQANVPASVAGKLLSENEAIASAKKLAGGEVMKIELDDDDDRYYYEVDLRDDQFAYEVKVDAFTGEVIQYAKERKSGKKITQSTTLLTKNEAISAAKKYATGNVKKIERDREDGRVVYEIEMKDDQFKYEIVIDAASGELLEFEKEQYREKSKSDVNKTASTVVSKSTSHSLQVVQPATPATPAVQKAEAPAAKKQVAKKAGLTKNEAIAIAKQKASGVVTDIELDDGVWEIEMEDGDVEYEIEIDASTGAILSFEKDE